MMNLTICGLEGDLGPEHSDTFRRDLHKDLKADDVPTNPPFNNLDWQRSDEDFRPLTMSHLTVNAALVIREHHNVRQR